MKNFSQDVLSATLTVLLAHALTYWFVTVLPNASISYLGIFAADQQQVTRFEAQNPTPPYPDIVLSTLKGELGRTLDGSSVFAEISAGARTSLPIVAAALLGTVLASVGVGFLPKKHIQKAARIGEAIAFLPPFVGPSIALVASISMTTFLAGNVLAGIDWLLLMAGIAAPCIALACAQASRITDGNLRQQFTTAMRASGIPERRIRMLLLKNLAVELAPSIERIAIVLITSLLLAEVIFGSSGLGSLTARAIRRSDMNLLLALTLFYSSLIVAIRLIQSRVLTAFSTSSQ